MDDAMTPADVEADRKDGTPDHERIWLEPNCADAEERNWCEDDLWGECDECGIKPTQYIRADLHTNRIAEMDAQLVAVAEMRLDELTANPVMARIRKVQRDRKDKIAALEAGLASLVKAYAACIGEDHRVGSARALLGDKP